MCIYACPLAGMQPLAQVRWACQKRHGSRRTRKPPTPLDRTLPVARRAAATRPSPSGPLSFAPGICGYHRVFAETALTSERSWKLMERVGMRKEAHPREAHVPAGPGGPWIASVRHALLAFEWPVHPASYHRDGRRPLGDTTEWDAAKSPECAWHDTNVKKRDWAASPRRSHHMLVNVKRQDAAPPPRVHPATSPSQLRIRRYRRPGRLGIAPRCSETCSTRSCQFGVDRAVQGVPC